MPPDAWPERAGTTSPPASMSAHAVGCFKLLLGDRPVNPVPGFPLCPCPVENRCLRGEHAIAIFAEIRGSIPIESAKTPDDRLDNSMISLP